jgi:MFS family permease
MTDEGGTLTQRLVTAPFVALAAATLAFFIAGGIVLPAAPQYAERALGANRVEIGIAIASFSIASLLVRPLVGWSTDRFGRRPVLVVGAVLTIGALLLHVVAGSLELFIVARSLFGAAEAFYFVAALAAASDLAPEGRRGEAISFFSLSLYLGLAIGPLVGEAVLGATGSYAAVWVAAALVSTAALGLTFVIPETLVARAPGEDRPRGRLYHPAGLFPGFLILLGIWGMAGYLAFVPLYVEEIGMSGASLPLAVYALVVVGLRIVGARLPDRLGAARLSGTALALSAAGLAVVGLVQSPAGLLVGTAIFASGVAFTFPGLLALAVSRVAPDERGTVVGTTSLFLDLSFGLAPVALGAVAHTNGYPAAFLVGAATAALGSAIIVLRAGSLDQPTAAG